MCSLNYIYIYLFVILIKLNLDENGYKVVYINLTLSVYLTCVNLLVCKAAAV